MTRAYKIQVFKNFKKKKVFLWLEEIYNILLEARTPFDSDLFTNEDLNPFHFEINGDLESILFELETTVLEFGKGIEKQRVESNNIKRCLSNLKESLNKLFKHPHIHKYPKQYSSNFLVLPLFNFN